MQEPPPEQSCSAASLARCSSLMGDWRLRRPLVAPAPDWRSIGSPKLVTARCAVRARPNWSPVTPPRKSGKILGRFGPPQLGDQPWPAAPLPVRC